MKSMRMLLNVVFMIFFTSAAFATDWCSEYGNKQEYDRQIKACTQQINGVDKVKDISISYYNRGNAYLAKGKYDQAIADYNKTAKLNPTYYMCYDNRGNAYTRKKQYDQAIADYKKAIKLNPKYGSPYYNLACLYSIKNNPTEACKWLQQSLDAGFNKWGDIKADPDLNNIRNTSCYKKIMAGK